MTFEFIFFLLLGAFLGVLVNGMAGFGTALFALGWWLQVMPASQAVALCLAVSIISGVPGFAVVRGSINWRATSFFVVPALIGIPLGLTLLKHINSETLMWVIAVFMVLYGAFFSFKKALPSLTKNLVVIDVLIGFLGGILGALAGLSGALPTMWISMRPWAKKRIRGILQPFNMIVLLTSAIGLVIQGAYTTPVLRVIGISLPATFAGTFLGIWLFGKMSDAFFQRTLIVIMGLSGLLLMLRLIISNVG